MKNALYVLAAAVFALQAVPVRSGELEGSFDEAKQEIARRNADRLAQARKVEGILRAFRLEKKTFLDKMSSLGFQAKPKDDKETTEIIRKFGPLTSKIMDTRPWLSVRLYHSCEAYSSELSKEKPLCSLGIAVVTWFDTIAAAPGETAPAGFWPQTLLKTGSLPELKAKTENYADFERLVAALEKRYSGADKSASAGKMRATPARFETAGLDDIFRNLPDLRPIFKTKCTLTYDGTFSPQTATADNCAEAKEQVINKCKFWTSSLEECRRGKMTCTNAATGAPVCLDFGAS